ncbi:MAG: MGMT family protein, partial [Candidatus Micrarchaeota archaeon]|nr:MGMT family protein [Candidatus Micrarchaeota archaeon]
MTTFPEKVWAACKKIPRGRVSTYAAIAKAIGKPAAVRAVGNALNKNPFKSVPCHRVVQGSGKIGGYARGSDAKAKKLR